jgi:hypothetical protein
MTFEPSRLIPWLDLNRMLACPQLWQSEVCRGSWVGHCLSAASFSCPGVIAQSSGGGNQGVLEGFSVVTCPKQPFALNPPDGFNSGHLNSPPQFRARWLIEGLAALNIVGLNPAH